MTSFIVFSLSNYYSVLRIRISFSKCFKLCRKKAIQWNIRTNDAECNQHKSMTEETECIASHTHAFSLFFFPVVSCLQFHFVWFILVLFVRLTRNKFIRGSVYIDRDVFLWIFLSSSFYASISLSLLSVKHKEKDMSDRSSSSSFLHILLVSLSVHLSLSVLCPSFPSLFLSHLRFLREAYIFWAWLESFTRRSEG